MSIPKSGLASVGTALLTLAALTIGCAVVGAARRSQDIQKLKLGMTPDEVLQVVGEPQEKEQVTGSEGPMEVWDYLIYQGGYWTDYSVRFKEGRLASLGQPAMNEPEERAPQQTPKAAASDAAVKTQGPERNPQIDELHRAYVTAYLQGYRRAEQDRDTVWSEAIAQLVPEAQREVKQREARAFVAGHKAGAGEERLRADMQKAWEEYRAGQAMPP